MPGLQGHLLKVTPCVSLHPCGHHNTLHFNLFSCFTGVSFHPVLFRGGDICSERVHDISCPTLVIHGAKDAMVAPEHVDFLHETIPFASKYIFEDGKHNLHMKYKDQFNAMVSEFLLST